jgi:hypothetical protein
LKTFTHPLIIPSRDQMLARRNELFAEHRCRPWLTMLIPPLTQLPLFVGSSMFLSRLSQPPSVFDSESFLTLTSLSHADPTAALPIALGLITLANVESSTSSRWFASAEVREREELEEKRNAEKRARGDIVLQPQKIVQSALRMLSVGRILIGALVPGVRNSHALSLISLSLSLSLSFHLNEKFFIAPSFDADADFVCLCADFVERGALLDLIGDFRSFAIMDIRLL